MKKILLLEDEEKLGEIYKKKFERSGYEVKWERLPEKILEVAKVFPADVVLIDHGIRGHETSGLDIVPDVKKLLPTAKIIALSNYSHSKLKADFEKVGTDSYFVKINTSPKMLVHHVEGILGE